MSEAKKIESIYKTLSKIQSEVGKIHKSANNPFHKSKYEDLEAILEVITPLNAEHGLALYFNVEVLEGLGPIIKGTLTNGTESIEGVCPLAADGKNLMQAYGSSMSYGRRYILRNMYNLITTDDDGEASHSREAKITQVKEKPKANKKADTSYIIPKECKPFAGQKITLVDYNELTEWIKNTKQFAKDNNKNEPKWFVEMQEAVGE